VTVTVGRRQTRDEGFVRGLSQEFLECRSMRHAYTIKYFGTLKNAPGWLKAKWNPYTLVLIRQCIRCPLRVMHFMNAANGKRVHSGEPFRAFARRSVYGHNYLWVGSDSDLDRPDITDYNRELYNRWRSDNPT